MAQNDAQERNEQPTKKRKEDAKKKGQVPRSRELNTALSLLVAALGMMAIGEALIEQLLMMLANGLTLDRDLLVDSSSMISTLSLTFIQSLAALVPFFCLLVLSAFAGPISLGGWAFSLSSITPKFEKIDPLKGLGRIFSVRGLMELTKAILKFLLVSLTAILLITWSINDLLALGTESVQQSLSHVAALFTWAFIVLSSVLGLIALVDAPFQMWQHTKQLRMSKQEIKDEQKDTDGRPEIKGRIRSLQLEVAQRRMMEEVPTADVVITNPTQFAVALRYNETRMKAPMMVAKGRDLVAARIKAIAAANDVTVFSAPPLARALYATTDLNQEIPASLFISVAQVLAYIYQLANYDPQVSDEPVPPTDLPIPEDHIHD